MTEGLIHIYTGEGKGKTTAGMGLAIRAAGQGLNVCIIQFLKGGNRGTGEQRLIEEKLPGIEFICSDMIHPMFLKKKPLFTRMVEDAEKTFQLCKEKAMSREYDLLVLEEINNVVANEWLDWVEVATFLEGKPKELEVVLTGRDAHPRLQAMADYVTEMLKIKHPYDKGYIARRGIEY
ncbi:MAG: cob(I)yrinic acid a,c-diamide adenosyltransferase [Deltaproteobacteria bacterium]|nr:cob(I)yrinic acid a,c-diamide adenosyltransferase [Deltaproteobacteria bacterium]